MINQYAQNKNTSSVTYIILQCLRVTYIYVNLNNSMLKLQTD